MSQRDNDIYASASLRGLLAEETAALSSDLLRCAGTHALWLTAVKRDTPPVLPLLGCWAQLRLAAEHYEGDLYARADELLPFIDDAFDLVLLRHALEVAPTAQSLLQEAIRVLAPGGMLVITGIHPLSGWMPWVYWHGRGQASSPKSPLKVERWLRRAELDIERVQRVGRCWPSAETTLQGEHVLGGGYVLIARKRRRMAMPIRLRPKAVSTRVHAGLAPGTRRSTVGE
ncbi:methyltransferase domain-containing protein [Dyella tabacisoli]|uniref:SAM-dependent methyltransferase n=1 Tax=Dyella tabacisoli TaxID=2282381 RepID=A0A369US08_9GAMM|nr:methyltransferase domain-containing protein [Dyella tabacisoli]RDD83301.1 SAM-dependent methyltransferase [Dyella tabacisoli]